MKRHDLTSRIKSRIFERVAAGDVDKINGLITIAGNDYKKKKAAGTHTAQQLEQIRSALKALVRAKRAAQQARGRSRN